MSKKLKPSMNKAENVEKKKPDSLTELKLRATDLFFEREGLAARHREVQQQLVNIAEQIQKLKSKGKPNET